MAGYSIDRRRFLSGLTGSLLSGILLPRRASLWAGTVNPTRSCWLDLCVPFVVEDPAQDLHSQILLTATGFPGLSGYAEESYATEYELRLYDSSGKEIDRERSTKRVLPPMRPTLISCRDLLPRRQAFFGGMRVRVRPQGSNVHHLGDLFSAAFSPWDQAGDATYVHAHPDPRELAVGKFFYSIPFPALESYVCQLALFNPNPETSVGKLSVFDRAAHRVHQVDYKCAGRASLLFDLCRLELLPDPFSSPGTDSDYPEPLRAGGVVAVINKAASPKVFAYLFMRGRGSRTFAVEHPLHQGEAPLANIRNSPFNSQGSFAAQSLLYTPLVFSRFNVGGVELSSRFYLSAGRWLEDSLWLLPFVTMSEGRIAWVSDRDSDLLDRLDPPLAERGVIKLSTFQSCVLDTDRLPLPAGFAGGLGVATVPVTSHSLMKAEVVAHNWNKRTFTHFRPGGAVAREYRNAPTRGAVATDYIVSGARVEGLGKQRRWDCLLAILNIEFQDEREATPELAVFGAQGLLTRRSLATIPALGCRHVLLSELFPELNSEQTLSVRLTDTNAMLIMSALHIDYQRRNISLDHGSDRHSTYQNYGC